MQTPRSRPVNSDEADLGSAQTSAPQWIGAKPKPHSEKALGKVHGSLTSELKKTQYINNKSDLPFL